MVTRGIVEKLIDRYTVKVRMPIFNRIKNGTFSSSADSLNDAVICTLPNYEPNVNVGDVVIVAFEDNNYGKPVVIGYLYRENMSQTFGDFVLNSLEVKLGTALSEDTTIGEVSSSDIKNIKSSKDNIQSQIDALSDTTSQIQSTLDVWIGNDDPTTTIINSINVNNTPIQINDHTAQIDFDSSSCYVTTKASGVADKIYFKYIQFKGGISEIPTGLNRSNIGNMFLVTAQITGTYNYNIGDYIILSDLINDITPEFIKIASFGGVTGGNNITVSQVASPLGGTTYEISHTESGNKTTINTNRAYIQSITTDNCGHILSVQSGTETVTDTHYTATPVVSNLSTGDTKVPAVSPFINIVENGSVSGSFRLIGGGATTVVSDSDNNITIATQSGAGLVFDGVYNEETNKAATVESVTSRISELSNLAMTGNINDLIQTDGDTLIFDCRII